MIYKPNSKLSLPVIISIVLHVVLVIILGYNALLNDSDNSGSINGQSIDAIMVDPAVITQQYQREQQHQASQQQVEKQRQQQIAQQAKELQEKQVEEQKRLKEVEKERLKAVEQQKQAEEQTRQAKQELEEQQKQALLAKQKAEQEAEKQKQQAAERAAAEKAAADKAAAEKAAADKAAKQKAAAEKAKNDKAINDLLGGLTSSGSPGTPSTAQTRKGVSDGELDKYKSLVLNAISNKFINPNKLYSGRNCVLKIQIAPDGLLLNVISVSGDDILCREAVSATKLAVIPRPSNTIYQEVREMTLDFQPK